MNTRFAAICAALTAITTFLLWLLPRYYSAPTFEDAVALHTNAFYLARLWVNFIHIFLALVAYGAAAWLLSRSAPGLAGAGFLWFVFWGFTELLGITTIIFAVNRTWRPRFATASAEAKAVLRMQIDGVYAVWDAIFFLLLVAFLLGSLCYGLAGIRRTGLTRWIGVLFLLGVPLNVIIMLGEYGGFDALNVVVSVVYPILQPVMRGLLGYWLWTEGERA